MTFPLTVAVLASGSGSNLQAILDRFNLGEDRSAKVDLVIGSAAGIGALERAKRAGVSAAPLPRRSEASDRGEEEEAELLLGLLDDAGADLVVLAGYMRLVPSQVVGRYWGRMVNVHPALLPAFGGKGMYGRRVHEAVLASGARVTGVTVHFVDEEYDRGPIISQWPVPVLGGDDAESLAKRVLAVEHRLLPSVVHAIANGRVALCSDGRCVWQVSQFGTDEFGMERPGGLSISP